MLEGLGPQSRDFLQAFSARIRSVLFSVRNDVFCQLWFDESVGELDENQSINLYRIVQEALTNVVKHANATEVKVNLKVSVEPDGEYLILNISDNGRGFDVTSVTKGLGMHGIEERVEALNGTLMIESGQRRGTHYRIKIPAGDSDASDTGKADSPLLRSSVDFEIS